MKTILLPTDFSNNSINAINYAMEMYKNEVCNFYILNVQKSSSFISDDMMVVNTSATIYSTIVDVAKKSINNIIFKIRKHYNNENHSFKAIVDYDNFVDSINQVSEKYKVDLIIMGTKGASGISKVLFGSNTVKVIQRGNVPVLAIPDNCKFTGLQKIGFKTGFKSLYNIEDIKPLKDIITFNKGKLYVLHVLNEGGYTNVLDKGIDLFEHNFDNPMFEYLQVKDNNIYEAIYVFIKNNSIKMITMCEPKNTLLERLFGTHTFETLAYNIDIPFLVLKRSNN